MIRATTFSGKKVAVFGLGSSGNATALSLMAGGAEVLAWDDGEASRAAASKLGIPLADLKTADWSGISSLVLAPGVPLTHPEPHWVVLKAREAGAEVIGDIEIFCRERAALCPDAPFIAITGTNGKSTTTALVAHILREAGRDVQMGGNIGKPILTLEPPTRERIHVVELSSFQIDLTPSLKPTVGVLLNLTPDHLDRHGPADDLNAAMRNYAAIKERLVAASQEAAAVGVDDSWCEAIAARHANVIRVSTKRDLVGGGASMVARGRKLVWRGGKHSYTFDLSDARALRGDHNAQNAAAASAVVAGQLGVDGGLVQRALVSFPGLAHRMEQVGKVGRVLFVNDSKATNADSTEKALLSWERGIYWILGGKPKEGGIETLSPLFPRVAKAYLIGAASDEFAATLDGNVPFERCGTLDAATASAARDAAASGEAEPVVLLSPACASYDQFKNFEERGDAFRKLVAGLVP
jgi:UDP-N-acetylmuramoylalanine--D-glutamate ligase